MEVRSAIFIIWSDIPKYFFSINFCIKIILGMCSPHHIFVWINLNGWPTSCHHPRLQLSLPFWCRPKPCCGLPHPAERQGSSGRPHPHQQRLCRQAQNRHQDSLRHLSPMRRHPRPPSRQIRQLLRLLQLSPLQVHNAIIQINYKTPPNKGVGMIRCQRRCRPYSCTMNGSILAPFQLQRIIKASYNSPTWPSQVPNVIHLK